MWAYARDFLFVAAIAAASVWFYHKAEPTEAQADAWEWKGFKEERFNFSLRYPISWALDFAYDRYAPGLLGVDINNKKKGRQSGCGAGYVDFRILVGEKPEAKEFQENDLKSQLFNETEMIKNSGNADLVELMGTEGKSVYKIKSEAPTLSLKGFCSGPLYLIDDDSGRFAYIFAGYGEDAKEFGEGLAKQIIASIGGE